MHDRFELIFRHSPVAMALTRRDTGQILDVNDACCRLFQRTAVELIGRTSVGVGTWAPDERARVLCGPKAGGRITRYETRLTSGLDVLLSVEPFTVDNGDECLLVTLEDVTSSRRAENALRESEARWKFALEGAGSGVWDWDVATDTVFFSDRWKAMLGHAPDEVGDTLDEWSSRVHPDDLDATMALVTAHLDGRTPDYVSEHRVRCKDGSYRWVLDRGKVVTRDPDGRPLRVVGTHEDVTAVRTAEERRRLEERRFRAIFDSAFQFIGLLDTDGTLLEANRTALDFAGITAEEIVGQPFWDAPWWRADEQTQQQLRDAVASASLGTFVRYEVEVQGRDGVRTTIDFSLKPITDDTGRVILLVPEGRDIGDVKRAHEDLHESEARFRSAFESAAIGMALVALDGQFVQVNPALCDLLGYTIDDLVGRTFQEITHPDDLQADLDKVGRLAAGAIRNYQMEKRYFHRDGHIVFIRLAVSAVRSTTGEVLYFIAQIEDMTAHRQAQQALERMLDEKDVLLHEVHHRVKNNLQVVSSLLSLQRRTVTDPVTREALDDSRRRVQTLALVHERLYQGSNLAAVDMHQYLNQLVGQLCRTMSPEGVQVRAQVTADAGSVPVNVAIPCGLIVNELVSNALKYAFAGRAEGMIRITFTRVGDEMHLEVADDGVGLVGAPRDGSIGMRLVESLARQVRGTFTVDATRGVHATVRFPAV